MRWKCRERKNGERRREEMGRRRTSSRRKRKRHVKVEGGKRKGERRIVKDGNGETMRRKVIEGKEIEGKMVKGMEEMRNSAGEHREQKHRKGEWIETEASNCPSKQASKQSWRGSVREEGGKYDNVEMEKVEMVPETRDR